MRARSDDETDPGERWPWTVDVDPLLVIPMLEHAPPVEAIGVPGALDQPAVAYPHLA